MYNKKNGVYYTPPVLAEFLAAPLITHKSDSILDPSYGEGSLLLAAERIFKKKNNSSNIHLFGCDTKPINGLLKHLPEANLKEVDFFDYPIENKFRTILMNPPYVRHHIQNVKKIDKYRNSYSELKFLNKSSDLWAYFLVKAVSHLEKKGSIGAILPWAFLQADYAKPIRKWLAENFSEIKTVALSEKYFEQADERVVVIWLKGFGQKCKSLKIASSKKIRSRIAFGEISIDNWSADRVYYSGTNNIEQILSRYKSEFGFTKFSDHADVKIGIVPGAVDYFIMSKQEARQLGFRKSRLIPILTSSDEFADYIQNGKKKLGTLIALRKKDHLLYRGFVRKGVDEDYHLRTHSELRTPWYAVKVGNVPDAFFHYRITKIPYLVPNDFKVQCTNSIHRIYFKGLKKTEKKWIIVSMLCALSQLSIETNSKTYGRGILKIEPKSLKNTLVIKRNDSLINPIYKQVICLLSENKKVEAMKVATTFINKELRVPKEFIELTQNTLIKFQELRLTSNKRIEKSPTK